MVSNVLPFLRFIALALSLSPAAAGNGGTCDNEQRPANKKTCVGQAFGELVPYPGDCSKFLVCNCEYPTVKQCPGGTWFDNKIKTCNYPHNVVCVEGDGGTSSTIGEITTTTTTTVATTTESSAWGRDCEAPAGMSFDICLKCSQGFLMSYPYNCQSYINCTDGCPVLNYCPADKVFNAFLKICDTPDTAQCVELPLEATTEEITTSLTTTEKPTTSFTTAEKPTTTTKKPTTTYTTTEIPTTALTTTEKLTTTTATENIPTTEEPIATNEATTIKPDQCLIPLGVETNICYGVNQNTYQTYPYNCTAYIRCKGEHSCLEYCENDKTFNSLLGICDEGIECHEIPLPTAPTTESSTTPLTTVNATNCLPPNVDPALCQGEKDNTVYPYEGDCSQYLLCENGEVKLKRCPNGWLLNSILMLCDEASEVICFTMANSTTEEYVTLTTAIEDPVYKLCLGQTNRTTFPYKENCQLYYYCRDNGHYYIISCPYNNFYDPYSGNCGPDVSDQACREPITTTEPTTIETTTLSVEQICANKPEGATHTYKENCSKYIYCKGNGGFLIMNCPYNSYYHPDSGNCGPSDDKNICRKSSQTTTSTVQTTTNIAWDSTASTTPKPVLDNICGNYSNGQLIAYPDNCVKYISCVKPIPIAFDCYNNWHFNAQQQICVAASESGCNGLPYNETTTTAPPRDICRGLNKGDRQAYLSNCQIYYECLGNGNYMLKACKEKEYFDPIAEQCSSLVDADYCQQNFDSTLPPTQPTAEIPQPQGICEGEAVGRKVSYPQNCSKYIVCESSIPVSFNCDIGLQFSLEEQTCVEPSQSDCGITTTTDAVRPTTMSTMETEAAIPPTTEPPQGGNICCGQKLGTHLAYPSNEKKYVVCLYPIPEVHTCNEGYFYKANTLSCQLL